MLLNLVTAPRAGLGAWAASSWSRCGGAACPVCAFVRRGHERVEVLRATGALVIVAKA